MVPSYILMQASPQDKFKAEWVGVAWGGICICNHFGNMAILKAWGAAMQKEPG